MSAACAAALCTIALVSACGAAPAGRADGNASSGSASSGAGTTTRTASAPAPVPTCVPPVQPADSFRPVGVSFSSASDGWLLGVPLSACTPNSFVQLRKTTDGGLKWTKAGAPAAPWSGGPVTPSGGVSAVLFGNAKDGWAYGPGLWATHNGGASWHRISTHGYAVYSMAATGTSVLAAFDKCGQAAASCDSPETFAIETAAVHTDTWRAVRGATGKGAPRLTAEAGVAYAYGAIRTSPAAVKLGLLTGPANGSKAWHSAATPCAPGAVTASAVTASHLLLGCALLGAHPATTRLYSSGDSGVKWKLFATLGLYDGASVLEQTPNGTLLVGGIYNGIALSHNGGRTWTSPAVDKSTAVGGGAVILAALTTNADGYLLVAQNAFWITRNGGKTWTQVQVR